MTLPWAWEIHMFPHSSRHRMLLGPESTHSSQYLQNPLSDNVLHTLEAHSTAYAEPFSWSFYRSSAPEAYFLHFWLVSQLDSWTRFWALMQSKCCTTVPCFLAHHTGCWEGNSVGSLLLFWSWSLKWQTGVLSLLPQGCTSASSWWCCLVHLWPGHWQKSEYKAKCEVWSDPVENLQSQTPLKWRAHFEHEPIGQLRTRQTFANALSCEGTMWCYPNEQGRSCFVTSLEEPALLGLKAAGVGCDMVTLWNVGSSSAVAGHVAWGSVGLQIGSPLTQAWRSYWNESGPCCGRTLKKKDISTKTMSRVLIELRISKLHGRILFRHRFHSFLRL